jgi:hypothetical protein
MKTKISKIFTSIISFLFVTVPFFASADSTGIDNPLSGVNDVGTLVSTILGYVVKIGGVFAIFAFIWSGYLFAQAQGNPEKLKEARSTFTNTCIAVAILLGAQLIASIVVGTLKSIS